MAFIGKQIHEGSKKAKITVSINKGRIGLVFRKGVVAQDALIDVLVGTEEDFGFLLVKRGEGTAVKPFGNSDNVVSWGASRKASVIYPAIKRAEAEIVSDDENGLLLKVAIPAAADPVDQGGDIEGLGLGITATDSVEKAIASEDTFGLGLDPEPTAEAAKVVKEKKKKN